MSLLFRLAEWHALAKLRMHTESTLTQMEKVTAIIGRQLRDFCNITCKAFKTTELPKEAEARARKDNRQQSKRASKVASQATPEVSSQAPAEAPSQAATEGPSETPAEAPPPAVSARPPKKAKTLNLFVYKIHALGDYAATIRLFGTTDSYSTQIVSIILHFIILCTRSRYFLGRIGTSSCQTHLRPYQQEWSCCANDQTRATGDSPSSSPSCS
jgi:hypothetical protein